MLKEILVASDLSPRADVALSRGLALARVDAARVRIVHAVDDDQPPAGILSAKQTAQALLAQQLEDLAEDLETPPDTLIRIGDPADAILDAADGRGPDLVVMGAHRRRALQDVFVGTTIERVMRRSPFPVLMAQIPPDRPYRKVLVAVDMSEASGRAAEIALRLGFLDDADITFLHAFLPLARGMMIYAGVEREAIEREGEDERKRKRNDLSGFLSGLHMDGARYRALLEEGPASDVILQLVEREAPDLLVIGARGESSLKRVLLGSVAQEVLRSIGIDTLVVPARD